MPLLYEMKMEGIEPIDSRDSGIPLPAPYTKKAPNGAFLLEQATLSASACVASVGVFAADEIPVAAGGGLEKGTNDETRERI